MKRISVLLLAMTFSLGIILAQDTAPQKEKAPKEEVKKESDEKDCSDKMECCKGGQKKVKEAKHAKSKEKKSQQK